MVAAESRLPPHPTWAYAYRIRRPDSSDRLDAIEVLLDRENAAALRENRSWAGRLVVEPEITYLLIVTDSPDQDREINLLLEAELIDVNADFSITLPLAIRDDPPGGDFTGLHPSV
jgi:hypothetical protein